jgi:hypothetical protein
MAMLALTHVLTSHTSSLLTSLSPCLHTYYQNHWNCGGCSAQLFATARSLSSVGTRDGVLKVVDFHVRCCWPPSWPSTTSWCTSKDQGGVRFTCGARGYRASLRGLLDEHLQPPSSSPLSSPTTGCVCLRRAHLNAFDGPKSAVGESMLSLHGDSGGAALLTARENKTTQPPHRYRRCP